MNVNLTADSTMTDAEVEVLQKDIMFFCNTPLGSLPQNRGFGLDHSILEEPYRTFRMKATVDIVSGVQKFYGVRIKRINITADENGEINVEIGV